ncbi:hypothetical protein WICMUC_001393 [Wickerhamomyces mucosus]|uniref:Uncharacterized protein n=1 Tax=Wickerhamomyces mucosus TaxID=1378264 RepID=A0A9P8TGV0_9ASCO|nr:hypothetical protein WICMUC_001393 [Wickerhamomyces mucosus]
MSRSSQFNVPVSFLQQQAYWLYENELEQLKNKIQKSTLSSDTITDTDYNNCNIKGASKDPDIFEPSSVTQSVPSSQQDLDSNSDSDLSTSSNEQIDTGSTLLYRSRIFSKPSKFQGDGDSSLNEENDLQSSGKEDTEDEYERVALDKSEIYMLKKGMQPTRTNGSSILNSSADSISKSALEEALLHNSHF